MSDENKFYHVNNFNRILGEITAVYHELAVHFSLSDSALMILYALAGNNGRYPLGDIINYTGLSKQTVNSSIRSLEKNNIVTLTSINGRNKLVTLTEKGSKISSETANLILSAENSIFESWNEADRQAYFDQTEKFKNALRTEAKKILL